MATLQEELDETISKLKTQQPKELSSDDPLLDENWNAASASIKLLTEALELIKEVPTSLPPVGSPYIRCPGMLPPWEQYQATKKAEWIAIHELYPGDFMRLAGGNASEFKSDSTSVSYDSKVKGDGGGQMDAFEMHKHKAWFKKSADLAGLKGVTGKYQKEEHWASHETEFPTGRTDVETRPKNITVELYVYRGK